jgi:hypothetical protein
LAGSSGGGRTKIAAQQALSTRHAAMHVHPNSGMLDAMIQ